MNVTRETTKKRAKLPRALHNPAMRKWATIFSGFGLMLLGGCATWWSDAPSDGRRFDFALIGDIPYSDDHITNQFPNMMRELNAADLEFVVHDGDIKAGGKPCFDQTFEDRLRDFQSFKHPLIYLFGDNEWTDCAKATNGFDPEERLGKLRELFTRGDYSLGRQRLPLGRQSNDPRFEKFRENVRWEMGGVMFVGLNVPGSTNNFGHAEFAERNAANLSWIKESFSTAKVENRRALMLIFQANPFPERGGTNKNHAEIHPGFREMLDLLARETLAFGKPVVLVHGDSHYFRIDKPLLAPQGGRRIDNFTRVETFGDPYAHWLRVSVDPVDPNIFTFRQQIIQANVR